MSDWQLHNCTCFHESAVSVIVYDNYRELLWSGFQDGRVSSFSVTQDNGLTVYSSFKLNFQIITLIPLPNGILCITFDDICYYSIGGIRMSILHIKDIIPVQDGDIKSVCVFSSACVVSDALLGNLFTSNNITTNRIVLGTSHSYIILLEANHETYEIKPIVQYSLIDLIPANNKELTSFTITDVISNHIHLYISGSNGKFYVLDGKILLKVASTLSHRLKHTVLKYIPNFSGNGVILQVLQCYDKGGYITHLGFDQIDSKTMYYCGVITVTNGNGFKGIVDGVKVSTCV